MKLIRVARSDKNRPEMWVVTEFLLLNRPYVETPCSVYVHNDGEGTINVVRYWYTVCDDNQCLAKNCTVRRESWESGNFQEIHEVDRREGPDAAAR